MCIFPSIISRKDAAHRFSPPGYPGGIEADFFPKINTFPDRRVEQNSDLLMRLYNKWCHPTCLEPIYCDSTLQNSRFAQPFQTAERR